MEHSAALETAVSLRGSAEVEVGVEVPVEVKVEVGGPRCSHLRFPRSQLPGSKGLGMESLRARDCGSGISFGTLHPLALGDGHGH